MRPIRLALALAVLALAAVLIASWTRREGARSPYVTAPVDRGPITARVTATGTVNPVTTVQVGTYVSVPLRATAVGSTPPVRRGRLLAKLAPPPFQVKRDEAAAELANARARLEKDRADLVLKEITLRRTRDLGGRGIV